MRYIVTACLVLCLVVTPCVGSTNAELQEKAVTPFSTTALGEIGPILQAIMSSNMAADQKERSVIALTELAKFQIEIKAKTTESLASKIFDISVKLISLGASIFAVVKVTN
jgi:hypothetical protein